MCADGGFSWVALGSVLVGAGVLAVALFAFLSDRSYRSREALARLLARFDEAGFMTLMWRLEQVSRPDEGKGDASSLERIDLDAQRRALQATGSADDAAKGQLILDGLAQDFRSRHAHMHDVYFFALRVHAWLVASPFYRDRRARLLNDSFGYQLLSTLLDHRVVACRLESDGRTDGYFPTQYGCLDAAYRDLVRRLASDLLQRRRAFVPPPEIQDQLGKKLKTTDARLEELRPSRE